MSPPDGSHFWQLRDGTSAADDVTGHCDLTADAPAEHQASGANANLSVITAITPARLSKRFDLGRDGELRQSPGGNLREGTLEPRFVATPDDLARLLHSLGPDQALTHGLPINGARRIVTRAAYERVGRPSGATTRTKDAFAWPAGPGVMMVDYDPAAGSEPLSQDRLIQTFREAVPALAGVRMVWRPSASSCIWHGDRELRGVKGQRLYILVEDATDIPRAGKVLVDRLWLAGHGYIRISKSGDLLDRTLADATVWKPEHLDFAGGASCGPGLEQRRGTPIIVDSPADRLDSRAALPDLTPAERQRLSTIMANAREEVRSKAESVRQRWQEARVAAMVPPAEQGDRAAVQKARRVARRALEHGVLGGNFPVPLEDGPVPVSTLLADPARYDHCLTFDPIEPDYGGGRLVGRLYLQQKQPVLHSFAHGGRKYRLERTVRFDGERRALCLAPTERDASAIAAATGIETWAAADGLLSGIDLAGEPPDRPILVCRRDDARNAPSGKVLHDTIRTWRREGRTVLEVLPRLRVRRDGSSFCDALLADGPEALAERIEAVLAPVEPDRDAMPLENARRALRAAMQAALDDIWAGKGVETVDGGMFTLADGRSILPTQRALKVATSIGKTREALQAVKAWLDAGRSAVVYAVPEHKLTAELMRRAEGEHGIVPVSVWHGRAATDSATGMPMCSHLEAVEAVQAKGGNAQALVCGKGGKWSCPAFHECAYQAQRHVEADFWIIPHSLLFQQKPSGLPEFRLLIVDEDLGDTGLVGIDNKVLVTADNLRSACLVPYGDNRKGIDDDASADLEAELRPIRNMARALLDACPEGPVTRQAASKAGLDHENCAVAGVLEDRRRVDLTDYVWPGMAPEHRLRELADLPDQRTIEHLKRFWLLLARLLGPDGPEASGNIAIVVQEDKETGATYKAFRLQWREAIDADWPRDALVMSATLRLAMVRPYFPHIQAAAEVRAETPYQRVTYWHGKSFAHSNVHALRHQQGEVLPKSAARLRQALWAHALALHRVNGGETLLIVPKAVEEWLRAEQASPPAGIHIAHHGAIAGRDEWKDIRTLIVAGRPMPNPQTVERIAGALTGEAVRAGIAADEWFTAEMRILTDKAGRRITIEWDTAGDGIVEAVRASITEDQIEQAIGRGRGVNRTAANPLDVHLLGTGAVEGLAIAALVPWQAPSKEDVFVALQGVWLENTADMATAMGMGREALKKVRQRQGQMGTFPYSNYPYENVPIWSGIRYRRKIERHGWHLARFAPGAVADPAAWLEARLGPVDVETLPVEPARTQAADAAGTAADEPTPPPDDPGMSPETAPGGCASFHPFQSTDTGVAAAKHPPCGRPCANQPHGYGGDA